MTDRLRRGYALLLLSGFSGLIFAYLWVWRFSYFHYRWVLLSYLGGAMLVLTAHRLYSNRRQFGLRFDNLSEACARFAIPAAGLSGLIVAAGFFAGDWSRPSWKMILPYFGWALVQQHVLQNFLKPLFQILGGRGGLAAWFPAAVVFALYHLPNPWLVLATFAMALAWCAIFDRTPNLLAAALGQTLLTVALLSFFKFGFVDQLEVGRGGFRFEQYGDGVKVAGGNFESGEAFVATLPGADRGKPSRVRVFDASARLRYDWTAFPEFDFSGEIAAGDLGFGPGDEIVVTPGPGASNPPWARVFSPQGELLLEVKVPWLGDGYGAWPAVNCRRIYLGAGPGPRHAQRLAEIAPDGSVTDKWEFPTLGLVNGLRGTRACEPADSPNPPAGLLLLWGSEIPVNPATLFLADPESGQISDLPMLNTTFGLRLALLQDQTGAVMAGAAGPLPGYSGIVTLQRLNGEEEARFLTFDMPRSCGANVAAVDWDGDGASELIAGEGNCPGRPPTIQIRSQNGKLLHTWDAY